MSPPGGRGQGRGSRQDGGAERLRLAEDGRWRPGETAAQAGRPGGEGPAAAGGEAAPKTTQTTHNYQATHTVYMNKLRGQTSKPKYTDKLHKTKLHDHRI